LLKYVAIDDIVVIARSTMAHRSRTENLAAGYGPREGGGPDRLAANVIYPSSNATSNNVEVNLTLI
jgi:hypothetical protein